MRVCGRPRFAFVLKNGYNHEVAGRAVGSLVSAYGSGATTGNKMMGVSPIFFCRASSQFNAFDGGSARGPVVDEAKAAARCNVQNDV
jgi:hypothetical protein